MTPADKTKTWLMVAAISHSVNPPYKDHVRLNIPCIWNTSPTISNLALWNIHCTQWINTGANQLSVLDYWSNSYDNLVNIISTVLNRAKPHHRENPKEISWHMKIYYSSCYKLANYPNMQLTNAYQGTTNECQMHRVGDKLTINNVYLPENKIEIWRNPKEPSTQDAIYAGERTIFLDSLSTLSVAKDGNISLVGTESSESKGYLLAKCVWTIF